MCEIRANHQPHPWWWAQTPFHWCTCHGYPSNMVRKQLGHHPPISAQFPDCFEHPYSWQFRTSRDSNPSCNQAGTEFHSNLREHPVVGGCPSHPILGRLAPNVLQRAGALIVHPLQHLPVIVHLQFPNVDTYQWSFSIAMLNYQRVVKKLESIEMKATWTEQAKSMLWNSINGAINRGMSLYFERVAEKGQKRDAEREREFHCECRHASYVSKMGYQ